MTNARTAALAAGLTALVLVVSFGTSPSLAEAEEAELTVHAGEHGSGSAVDPANLDRVVAEANDCITLRLTAGFYPPLRLHGRSCISIIGPTTGVATFSSGSLHRGTGIDVHESSNIRIEGVHIVDVLRGIRVSTSTDVELIGNDIERTGHEAVRIVTRSANVRVEANRIHDTGIRPDDETSDQLEHRVFGEGIFVGTHSDPSDTTHHVEIVANEISATGAEAIDIKRGSREVQVAGNVIHGVAPSISGAVVASIGPATDIDAHIEIVGNVISNVRTGSAFTDGNAIVAGAPTTIRANVIADIEHRGVWLLGNTAATVSRNVIFATGFEPIDPPRTPLAHDNLGREVTDIAAFADVATGGAMPTASTQRLISLLEGDTPIVDLERAADELLESLETVPPGWPLGNTAVAKRTRHADSAASELDWFTFTRPTDRAIGSGRPEPAKAFGQFRTQCSFSHFSYDDPIAAPEVAGAAPLLMYFGNHRTTASSTYESLRDSGTSTCNGVEGNRSAYWVPAVFDAQGFARVPSRLEVHYGSHDNSWSVVEQAPPGLGMTAGGEPGNPHVRWGCERTDIDREGHDRPLEQVQETIPRCDSESTLLAHVQFPQCLTIETFEYPVSGFFGSDCPAGAQYTTAIEFYVAWDPVDHDGRTDEWWLSADIGDAGERYAPGSTLQAGRIGAWNPALADQIHSTCVERLAECGWDLIDDNRRLGWVEHFDVQSTIAYDGPPSVAATDLSAALCPGDFFAEPADVATCSSRVVGYRQHHGSETAGIAAAAHPTAIAEIPGANPASDETSEPAPRPLPSPPPPGGHNPATTIPVYDTAWQMLVRGTPQQADTYFATLAAHGFTGAWAGVIHHAPATYVDSYNGGGQVGNLIDGQVVLSNGYTDHVRQILDAANRHGQKVGLVVAWQNTYLPGGNTESGDRARVHGTVNTGNAYAYGLQMVEEFGGHPAVSMWVFGGDAGTNNTDANKEVWRVMARAVRDAGSTLPIIYHTPTSAGETGTFRHLNYVGEPWLDMVAPETGHQQSPAETERELRTAVEAYGLPVWQGESRYYNITFDWIAPSFRNPGVNEVRADAEAARNAGVSGYVYGDAGRWNWCAGFGDTSPCNANDIAASFGPGERAVIDVFRAG
ncbi:MAG: DUF4038 domain-containing protein [Acidimicrobiales bacterium]